MSCCRFLQTYLKLAINSCISSSISTPSHKMQTYAKIQTTAVLRRPYLRECGLRSCDTMALNTNCSKMGLSMRMRIAIEKKRRERDAIMKRKEKEPFVSSKWHEKSDVVKHTEPSRATADRLYHGLHKSDNNKFDALLSPEA